MELATIANLAEITSAAFVVGGVIFAVIQIRQVQRQREETASIEIIRAWQGAEFSRALALLSELPDGAGVDDLRTLRDDAESAAHIVCNFLESVGIMVHRRMIPIEVAEELLGGLTAVLWRKLSSWIKHIRAVRNPRAYEWFEWLYDRFCEIGDHSDVPANILHRDWRP